MSFLLGGALPGRRETFALPAKRCQGPRRDAANRPRGHVVGCLPMMEEDRLVGIVTISDVLETLGRGDAPPRGRR
jgi:CBS domain-containing protein